MQAEELSARCGLPIVWKLASASAAHAAVPNKANAIPRLNPSFIDDLRADHNIITSNHADETVQD